MASPTVNNIGNIGCYQIAFLYDSTSAVNATYLNCGDYTPMSAVSTAVGAPSAVFLVTAGIPASVVLTSGILSAGNPIGGYDQRYVPYAQVVTTVASLTAVPPGNYSG